MIICTQNCTGYSPHCVERACEYKCGYTRVREDAGLSPTLSLTGGMRERLTCAPGTNNSLGGDIARAPPPGYFCGSAPCFVAGVPPWDPQGFLQCASWTNPSCQLPSSFPAPAHWGHLPHLREESLLKILVADI